MTKREKPAASTWRPPTRRTFVSMLGAAAAAIAVRTGAAREREARADPPKKPKPRWIGHC